MRAILAGERTGIVGDANQTQKELEQALVLQQNQTNCLVHF
jgi:hypothetical protein